eukprot:UN03485
MLGKRTLSELGYSLKCLYTTLNIGLAMTNIYFAFQSPKDGVRTTGYMMLGILVIARLVSIYQMYNIFGFNRSVLEFFDLETLYQEWLSFWLGKTTKSFSWLRLQQATMESLPFSLLQIMMLT